MKSKIDRQRRRLLRTIAALPAVTALGPAITSASESKVIEKPIPSSGERIPVIGIGTSRVFEVGATESERQGPLAALSELRAFGNAMIDTSPMYGSAEAVIGELLPSVPKPYRFFLATKVWTHGREEGIAQMNESFRLLGSDVIDLMQIHNLVDWRTHIETLREWKGRGRIRYIGITHYTESAHDDLARVMELLPELDFVQVNYSLLEPAAEQQLLPLARERGIAVIANRPFARGSWFSLTRGQSLPRWATEVGIQSWAQFVLKWIVSHPAITCTIPGTGKASHMRDNMQAARGILPDPALRQRMRDTLRTL